MAARKASRAAASGQLDSELSPLSEWSSDENYDCPDDPVSLETEEEDEHDNKKDVEISSGIPNQQSRVQS